MSRMSQRHLIINRRCRRTDWRICWSGFSDDDLISSMWPEGDQDVLQVIIDTIIHHFDYPIPIIHHFDYPPLPIIHHFDNPPLSWSSSAPLIIRHSLSAIKIVVAVFCNSVLSRFTASFYSVVHFNCSYDLLICWFVDLLICLFVDYR